MTAEQIRALGPALAAYLRPFEPCFVDCSTVEHLHTYCRGLLSDLPRKSVEPIALAAGTAVRTLQEFLRDPAFREQPWQEVKLALGRNTLTPAIITVAGVAR
jgi:hypothetical protein